MKSLFSSPSLRFLACVLLVQQLTTTTMAAAISTPEYSPPLSSVIACSAPWLCYTRYDAFGNLITMTGPGGHDTTLTYDIRGNRTAITDPDTGTTSFAYNTLGELISQTDAGGNTVTITYDVLGRMISRSEPEGTSSRVYDTQTNGIGKLASISRGEYMEEYFYDVLGRPFETRTTIAGETFSTSTAYDLFGRPETLTYPTGYTVRTQFNLIGYPWELRQNSGNTLLWRADTINARGQLEQVTLGNGMAATSSYDPDTGRVDVITAGTVQHLSFTWDAIGNLLTRSDALRGLTESFTYDGLNRLTASQVAGQPAVTLTYNAPGNITFKSDVGTYTYGEHGAGPHAVTSIVGPGAASYTYDANGNRIRKSLDLSEAFAGQIFCDGFEGGDLAAWGEGSAGTCSDGVSSVAYTSFNKPSAIAEGSTTLTLDYGPNYARYRQVVTTSQGTTSKIYIGGLLERETSETLTRDRHYIRAGGQVVAVYTIEDTGSASVETTRYLHRDHLGSVHTITDEAGTVAETLSFDAWGLRRNAADWSPATAPILPGFDRGFTGHEHLDEVSLIHMNGRVYDPAIGRFLSADPFVQAPEFSQSLNRYTYVLNNPLSLTDPSGFFFKSLFRGIRRAIQGTVSFIEDNGYQIVRLVAAALPPPHNIAATIATDFAISFHAGIQSGAGFGDAFRAGLRSAFISGAESFALLQIAQVFPAATPEVLREHWEKKASTLSYITNRLKSQVPKVLARGVVKGVAGRLRGGQFIRSFGFSLAIDTLSIGRDLMVEVEVLDSCRDNPACISEKLHERRLTLNLGKESQIGVDEESVRDFIRNLTKGASDGDIAAFVISDMPGGLLSYANLIPGFNSAAGFHDSFVERVNARLSDGLGRFLILSPPTISPTFALNYIALGVTFPDRDRTINLLPINYY